MLRQNVASKVDLLLMFLNSSISAKQVYYPASVVLQHLMGTFILEYTSACEILAQRKLEDRNGIFGFTF